MPNNYLSVLYKHNWSGKYKRGVKSGGGGHKHTIAPPPPPIKKVGAHAPLDPTHPAPLPTPVCLPSLGDHCISFGVQAILIPPPAPDIRAMFYNLE